MEQDLQLKMVSLHSSEIFRLLLLLRFHGNNKLIRKLVVLVSVVVETWPTDHFCSQSVLRVSSVAMPLLRVSPCPWSRRRRHLQWPTLLRLFQKADSFPQCLRVCLSLACVFTLSFASIPVIDLFSVIGGRNHALGCVCVIPLLNLKFAVFVVQSFD